MEKIKNVLLIMLGKRVNEINNLSSDWLLHMLMNEPFKVR